VFIYQLWLYPGIFENIDYEKVIRAEKCGIPLFKKISNPSLNFSVTTTHLKSVISVFCHKKKYFVIEYF